MLAQHCPLGWVRGVSGGPASPGGEHLPPARGGPERPVGRPVLGSARVGVTGAVLGRAGGQIVGRRLPGAADVVGGLVAGGSCHRWTAPRPSRASAGTGWAGAAPAGYAVTSSSPHRPSSSPPAPGPTRDPRFPPLKGGTLVCAHHDTPAPQKTKDHQRTARRPLSPEGGGRRPGCPGQGLTSTAASGRSGAAAARWDRSARPRADGGAAPPERNTPWPARGRPWRSVGESGLGSARVGPNRAVLGPRRGQIVG